MKKRLSSILLVTEITAIVMLHALKIEHQKRNDYKPRTGESWQQANNTINHSYSFFILK